MPHFPPGKRRPPIPDVGGARRSYDLPTRNPLDPRSSRTDFVNSRTARDEGADRLDVRGDRAERPVRLAVAEGRDRLGRMVRAEKAVQSKRIPP